MSSDMLNYVADKLFRAEDNDALEDKLDELLDDTEFMVHVQAVAAGASPVTSPVMSHMLSHALPTYLKRCVFYSRRADAALWGILAAARLQGDEVQLRGGMAEHLLHIWHDSARKFLQLAVSMGFELPEQFRSLVPPGPPISPQEEWHAARARADHMLQQLSEAKEIDAAVHPPVEDDDD